MIPEFELRAYYACLGEAWSHASAGRPGEGLACLDLGLAWAQARPLDPITGVEGELEPWEALLAAAYRTAIERYTEQFLRPAQPSPAGEILRQVRNAHSQSAALLSQSTVMLQQSLRLREAARAERERTQRLREYARLLRARERRAAPAAHPAAP